VDAVYVIAGRDSDIGGGIMGGALAYRIFIWLLPAALVVIGGIGLAADASSDSPEDAARSLGLRGVVSSSVANATRGSSRWYALLIGIPVLIWATRSLLKALIVVHRLVWGEVRRAAHRPSTGATLWLLALMVGFAGLHDLARAVGLWTGTPALRILVALAGTFVWWLLVSARLPHRDAPLGALVPGALILAFGFELLTVLATYLISPRVASSESAYGVLGVAAALLFGLYLVSRLIVASAVTNVTLWERGAPVRRVD
jgi:uncharacterized BrkB/YihY/UPF0761 family membrane protein